MSGPAVEAGPLGPCPPDRLRFGANAGVSHPHRVQLPPGKLGGARPVACRRALGPPLGFVDHHVFDVILVGAEIIAGQAFGDDVGRCAPRAIAQDRQGLAQERAPLPADRLCGRPVSCRTPGRTTSVGMVGNERPSRSNATKSWSYSIRRGRSRWIESSVVMLRNTAFKKVLLLILWKNLYFCAVSVSGRLFH